MKRLLLGIAAGIMGLAIYGAPAEAVTLDFEGLPTTYYYYGGSQNIGTYYSGVTIGSQATILDSAIYGYNDAGYPAHSGTAVMFSISTPIISLTFDTPTDSISLWYTSYSNLYMDVYNSSSTLLATVGGPGNYTTNSLLSYTSGSSDIASITIHDSGNYFTIDDVTFNTASVPEPGTLLLLGSGMAGLAIARRLRKKA